MLVPIPLAVSSHHLVYSILYNTVFVASLLFQFPLHFSCLFSCLCDRSIVHDTEISVNDLIKIFCSFHIYSSFTNKQMLMGYLTTITTGDCTPGSLFTAA